VSEAVKLSHATGLPADSPSIQQGIAMPVLPTTSARVQQVAKELGIAPDNPDVQTAIRFSSITGLQPTNPELLKALGLLPYSQYTTPTKEGMTQTQGTKYYGSDGSIATIGNNDTLSITDSRGKTTWYQKHQNDNEHINTKTYKNAETNSTATTHKQSIVVQNDKGQTVATLHLQTPAQTSNSSNTNNNSSSSGTIIDFYPPGIPKSSIPKMNEDLYILKTQLVPPVVPIGSACPLCDKPMKSATSSSKACGCPNLGNQRAKHEKENCTRPNTYSNNSSNSNSSNTFAPSLQDNMFTSSYDGAYTKSPNTKEQPFDYRTLPHTFDPIPMLNSFAKF
jgi:hypothetical protein